MTWKNRRRQPVTMPDETPLQTLVEHFVSTSGRMVCGKEFSRNHINRIATTFAHFSLSLRKETPLVGDLTMEAIERFEKWHAAMFPDVAIRNKLLILRALLRYQGKLQDVRPLVSGRPRRLVLSDAPDTLWGICLLEYFPTNTRIQSPQTIHQYRVALTDFREALGHDATPDDLCDDNVGRLMNLLLQKGAAKKTVNERRARINALWTWLAKRRRTELFPTNYKLREPRRIPKAWTADQLRLIFISCREETGEIVEGIKASDFWQALHSLLWDSGERIGALMACRWEWLDFDTGLLEIPAEARKGGDADMMYRLHPRTLAILARMKAAGHPEMFPWPHNEATFYNRYRRLLKRVGLEHDRKSKTHRMRRSVASHLQAAGIDACTALGHSTPEVTRRSYLDPRIVVTQPNIEVLFDPRGAEPPAEPRAIEYREPDEPLDPESLDWL